MEFKKNNRMEVICFEGGWKQDDLYPMPTQNADMNKSIVFSNEDIIKELLQDSCQHIVMVRMGNRFAKVSESEYRINPNSKEDYNMMISSMLSDDIKVDRVIHAWNFENVFEEYEESLTHSVYSMLYLVQAFLQNRMYQRISMVYLYENSLSISRTVNRAVDGFAKVVELEQPLYRYKLVGLSKASNYTQVLQKELESYDPYGCSVCYTDHLRLKKCYLETNISETKTALRASGVYVITGGTGGLGKFFAEKLLANYSARVALIGRRELSKENREWMQRLVSEGKELIYVKADLSVGEQVQKAIDDIIKNYGDVHGILHCAGILNDSYIINKRKDEFQDVIQSKVLGTINLDEALKDRELDFMVFFSSITSIKGNVGQCDYAYANDFLNYFSEYRNELCSLGLRKGRTVSINWPLWEHGGMHISDDKKSIVLEDIGVVPLPDEQGFAAFEDVVKTGTNQVAVVYGEREKVISLMAPKVYEDVNKTEKKKQQEVYHIDETELGKKTEYFLVNLFSELFQISEDRIKNNITMQEYGLDSITVNKFNLRMEQEIGTISKMVLYECQTIGELEQYLITNHKSELIQKFGLATTIPKVSDSKERKQSFQWEEMKSFVSENNSFKALSNTSMDSISKDIAIVGVAGKYPEADTIPEYWENLKNGKNCISLIPSDRWEHEKYFDDDYQHPKPGKYYCKHGGFLNHIDQFDPLFFKLSPVEAEIMDPQERLLLESVWETFEDAGYAENGIERVRQRYNSSNIGVFIGSTNYQYQLWAPEEWAKGSYIMPCSSAWSISNRISYVFNLAGPSMTVDTACSSSLVAIHQACESLLRGECEMAIAGGANLYLHPFKYVQMCYVHMLSHTGKCHSFGNEGDGFVPGEGIGTILLKPLEKAIVDQDHIYGVIKGTAINHGGKTSGYSVPNPLAQQSLIEDAIKDSGIDPRTISYIEAHGTGTILGDPIEVSSLTKAFEKYTDNKNYCSIGSVKTNIGHLEGAAGIAGITKVILQMKHRKLVPSLNAEVLNPNIDFENSPFYVQRKLSDWKRPSLPGYTECPLRAGISSFGAGGTNAHVILEEYVLNKNENALITDIERAIVVLSARSDASLKEYVHELILYFEDIKQNGEWNEIRLCDIAYTLCVGRKRMEEKLAILAYNKDDLMKKLKEFYTGQGQQADVFRGSDNQESRISNYLAEDDDAKEMIERWIEKGKLEKIAAMWVNGIEVDLSYWFRKKSPKRIYLPTCPFQKKSYWIKKIDNSTIDNSTIDNDIVKSEEISDEILYEKTEHSLLCTTKWELNKSTKTSVETGKKQSVCIVTNKRDGKLQKALKAVHGDDQVKLLIFEEGISGYVSEEDSSKLSEANIIYFLCGIQETNYDIGDLAQYKKYERTGVITIFRIIQELAKRNDGHAVTLKVVTNNIYRVLDGDIIRPFSASVIGLVKSAVKEYSFLNLSYIDISQEDVERDSGRLARMIHDEEGQKKEQDIAIRNGKRFVRRIYEVELEQKKESAFRKNGVYILIGGLGSIGIDCAKHLSKNYCARLMIVGRSKLGAEQEKKIRQIEDLGGSVQYIAADISKKGEMQRVIDETEEIYECIHGIIHTAMVFTPCSIENMNEVTLKESLSPKTIGLINLYKAIKDKSIDFVLFFSSGQSLVGNADRSHYAAACTFEDAYALGIAECLPFDVKIINWSFWATVKGKELDIYYRDYILNQGVIPIEAELGMKIVEHILKSNGRQVFTFNIKPFVREWMGIDASSLIQIPAEKIGSATKELTFDGFDKFVPEQLEGFAKVLRLATIKLLNAFQEQKVFLKGNEEYEQEELFEQLEIIPDYGRLFEELIRIFERAGVIRKLGNKIITCESIVLDEFKKEMDQCDRRMKELSGNNQLVAPYIHLLDVCMNELWPILQGNKLATEVLFSKSSTKLVENIYKGNTMADYFNRLMVQAVVCIVADCIKLLNKGEKIKILEIGAGTGGASAMLLQALAEWKDQVQYDYTDISAFFIKYGKETFGSKYPFVSFKELDVEKGLNTQAFMVGDYDVVIASNVLHATKNIRNTLRNVKALLVLGGWLILNEAVQIGDVNTLTFGLTQGWWLYDDPEERLQGGPLLSTSMWKNVLAEEGFQNIRDLASTDFVDFEFIQNVIAAQSDGTILLQVEHQEALQNETSQEYKKEEKEKPIRIEAKKPSDVKAYVKKIIVECVSETLSMDKEDIGLNKSFMDYGLDSILGGNLVHTINERLHVELKPIELFDYSDVEKLTRYIVEEYGKDIIGKCLSSEEIEEVQKREEVEMPVNKDSTELEEDDEMLELFEKLEKGEIDMEQAYQDLEVLEK